MSDEEFFEDVACTVCACVCDDLRVTVRDGRISDYQPFCSRIGNWFEQQNSQTSVPATRSGVEISLNTAINEAASILRHSKSPLFYGLSQSSTEGQRAAVALADRLGATIDTTASEGHAPSIATNRRINMFPRRNSKPSGSCYLLGFRPDPVATTPPGSLFHEGGNSDATWSR